MLNLKIEILSLVLLVILVIAITPLMVTLFTDVLPTNKNMEIDEIIDRLISKGSTAEYIVSSEYLYIIETTKENEIKKHFAYKGKTSGFIPTPFTYGTGDKIKRYSNSIYLEDIFVKVIVKKHNENNIFEIISMGNIVTLTDNNGNELNHIGPHYFHVLESIDEDWEINGLYNDNEYKILDRDAVLKNMGDE